jgi:hypothetical protein
VKRRKETADFVGSAQAIRQEIFSEVSRYAKIKNQNDFHIFYLKAIKDGGGKLKPLDKKCHSK